MSKDQSGKKDVALASLPRKQRLAGKFAKENVERSVNAILSTTIPSVVEEDGDYYYKGFGKDFKSWGPKTVAKMTDRAALAAVKMLALKQSEAKQRTALGDMALACVTSAYLNPETAKIEDRRERAETIKDDVDAWYQQWRDSIVIHLRACGYSQDKASSAVAMVRGLFDICNGIAFHRYDELADLLDFNRRKVLKGGGVSKNRVTFSGRKVLATKTRDEIVAENVEGHEDRCTARDKLATNLSVAQSKVDADVLLEFGEWKMKKAEPTEISEDKMFISVDIQDISGLC